MKLSELKQALKVLTKNKIVPFIWGQQGIGKTQSVKQFAKENNLGFVHLYLGTQADVGDVLGLLIKDDKNKTAYHTRPQWFPTEGEGILFLDEINRCHPDIMQAMFSLMTEGRIHNHILPSGWSVVAAGNYQSNAFNTTDVSDAAFMSRFCHIDIDPSPEEFCFFLEEKGADMIAEFIRQQPEMMMVRHKERFNFTGISPEPRAWADKIAQLEKETMPETLRYELYQGMLGTTAASAFMVFRKNEKNEKLKGKDVLNKYSKVRESVLKASSKEAIRFDYLNTAVEEIITYLNAKELKEEQMNNFKEFLIDIPLEMGLKVINRIQDSSWSQKDSILNNAEFIALFKKAKLLKEKK